MVLTEDRGCHEEVISDVITKNEKNHVFSMGVGLRHINTPYSWRLLGMRLGQKSSFF